MGVKVGQPIKKSITIIQMVQFGLLNAQVNALPACRAHNGTMSHNYLLLDRGPEDVHHCGSPVSE